MIIKDPLGRTRGPKVAFYKCIYGTFTPYFLGPQRKLNIWKILVHTYLIFYINSNLKGFNYYNSNALLKLNYVGSHKFPNILEDCCSQMYIK